MIKLLAVDMDGTCLNSAGEMTDRTLEALRAAAQAGIIVVPTTGRSRSCLPVRIKKEDFYRYVISSNGACSYDRKTGQELYREGVDTDSAIKLLEGCKGYPFFITATIDGRYCAQGRIVYRIVKHILKEDADNLKRVRSIAKELRLKQGRAEELQLYYFGKSYGRMLEELVRAQPDMRIYYTGRYARIYGSKATKGAALLELAGRLGISPGEIGCIGDEENDISMLEVAGHGFAMGNAAEKLKSIAKTVLPRNDEDGVATAIYGYILGQQGNITEV